VVRKKEEVLYTRKMDVWISCDSRRILTLARTFLSKAGNGAAFPTTAEM
jgi:hypothetical protein